MRSFEESHSKQTTSEESHPQFEKKPRFSSKKVALGVLGFTTIFALGMYSDNSETIQRPYSDALEWTKKEISTYKEIN